MYPPNGQYATKDKDGGRPQGTLGNDVSLADGPDDKANGSYQFHGTHESYIIFRFNSGTLNFQDSITVLCWVYIAEFSISPGFLFVHYSEENSKKNFGMAIVNATLAAYFKGTASPDIQSERLDLNHWHYVGASHDHNSGKASLWVNGTEVKQEVERFFPNWTVGSVLRMGFKFKGRIAALQVYNVYLTKQQIEDVKCVVGKNISSKVSVG